MAPIQLIYVSFSLLFMFHNRCQGFCTISSTVIRNFPLTVSIVKDTDAITVASERKLDIGLLKTRHKKKTITKRIVSYFNPMTNNAINVSELKKYVESISNELDYIHITTLLHRSSKANIAFADIVKWNLITSTLDDAKESFSSQTIGNCLYWYGKTLPI